MLLNVFGRNKRAAIPVGSEGQTGIAEIKKQLAGNGGLLPKTAIIDDRS